MYGGRTYGRAYGRLYASYNWWNTGVGIITGITASLVIGWRKRRGTTAWRWLGGG